MSVIPKIQGQQCAIMLFLTVCGKNTSVKCCGLRVSRTAEQPGAETIPKGAGWPELALDTSPAGWPELAQDPSWCCPAAPGLLHRGHGRDPTGNSRRILHVHCSDVPAVPGRRGNEWCSSARAAPASWPFPTCSSGVCAAPGPLWGLCPCSCSLAGVLSGSGNAELSSRREAVADSFHTYHFWHFQAF